MSAKLEFQSGINKSVKFREAKTERVTSDAGIVLMAELLEDIGLINHLAAHLTDRRNQARVRIPFESLLRQLFAQRIAGWTHLRDTVHLCKDPAFLVAVLCERGEQVIAPDKTLSSQSSLSRLLDQLSESSNLRVLEETVTKLGMEHMLTRNEGKRLEEVIIDVDAMPLDAHGKQEGCEYNGYYKRKVFLPLIASCGETGDVLGAELRPGTQREVTDCDTFIVRIAQAVREHAADRVTVRLDAGFNSGALCATLEQHDIYYVMRLRKNPVLDALADEQIPEVELTEKAYYEIEYAAQLWDHARRVVVVVKPERTETGGYSRYYLVTNLPKAEYPGADMAVMYGRRGKAEMHQGEMKAAAVSMSLSSSPRAKSHYRNRIIQREEQEEQTEQAASGTVRAQNAAMLQILMLVYQFLHIGRSVWHSAPGASAARPCLAIGDVPSSIEADTTAMPQEGLVKPAPAALPGQPAESLALPCAAPQDRESAAGVNRSGAPVTPQAGKPREGTVRQADTVQQSNATPEQRPPPAAAPEGAAGDQRGGLRPAPASGIAHGSPGNATIDAQQQEPHMHIHTFRLRILKVGATISKHARYIIFEFSASASEDWARFRRHLPRLRWHCLAAV